MCFKQDEVYFGIPVRYSTDEYALEVRKEEAGLLSVGSVAFWDPRKALGIDSFYFCKKWEQVICSQALKRGTEEEVSLKGVFSDKPHQLLLHGSLRLKTCWDAPSPRAISGKGDILDGCGELPPAFGTRLFCCGLTSSGLS